MALVQNGIEKSKFNTKRAKYEGIINNYKSLLL